MWNKTTHTWVVPEDVPDIDERDVMLLAEGEDGGLVDRYLETHSPLVIPPWRP